MGQDALQQPSHACDREALRAGPKSGSFQQPAAENKTMLVSYDLETFDKFVNHRSFHRLSGDQDREARASAYQDMMNLIPAQTEEDKMLIQLPPTPSIPDQIYWSL